MSVYHRPLVRFEQTRPSHAVTLGSGPGWFSDVEVLRRDAPPEIVGLAQVPPEALERLTAPRAPVAGLAMDRTRIMGILNVTPDSFSDGGKHLTAAQALARGRQMVVDGADLIDIGGESTRPGAVTVPEEAEIARTEPVIGALSGHVRAPISIDTRKAVVAQAAVAAGARIVNDVSGLTHDPLLARYVITNQLPVCIMHAKGDPETMQVNPRYDDVLLDVYDFLAAQVCMLEGAGLPRNLIVIDPGIGFGKTLEHNLALLNRLSLFHSLGCPVLLGASRKRFIGTLTQVDMPAQRVAGSVGVALAAAAQGVQILRVHDVAETRQALTLWQAVQAGR